MARPKRKTHQVRVRSDLLRRIQALAENDRRTIPATLDILLERALADTEHAAAGR